MQYFNDSYQQSFSVGTNDLMNNNNSDYVCYCFAEIQGYSKFGSYTGNGNADGHLFIQDLNLLGLLVKRTEWQQDWIIFDNKKT